MDESRYDGMLLATCATRDRVVRRDCVTKRRKGKDSPADFSSAPSGRRGGGGSEGLICQLVDIGPSPAVAVSCE